MCNGTGDVTEEFHAEFMKRPYVWRGRDALFAEHDGKPRRLTARERMEGEREDAERQERHVIIYDDMLFDER